MTLTEISVSVVVVSALVLTGATSWFGKLAAAQAENDLREEVADILINVNNHDWINNFNDGKINNPLSGNTPYPSQNIDNPLWYIGFKRDSLNSAITAWIAFKDDESAKESIFWNNQYELKLLLLKKNLYVEYDDDGKCDKTSIPITLGSFNCYLFKADRNPFIKHQPLKMNDGRRGFRSLIKEGYENPDE